MTNDKAYKLNDAEGSVIIGIYTEKELERFADAGWAVVEELDPADDRIRRSRR